MATNHNSNLTKEITDVGKIQVMKDRIPNEFSDKIVLVCDVNPKHARITNYIKKGLLTNATTATLATTALDRETYITNLQFAYIRDATATSVEFYFTMIIDGLTTTIFSIPGITLNAGNDTGTISFVNPIKIDKGSNILLRSTTNVGNFLFSGTVYGYTVENINA
jgi:hypothetical protein